jgi:ankyrin repeat protein
MVHGEENLENKEKYVKQMLEFIKNDDVNNVRSLIESSYVNIDESLNEYSHNSPLMEAANQGKFNVMKYLIEAHADINFCNEYHSTVMNELVRNKSLPQNLTIEMVQYLIQAGVDINMPGSDGKTALMYACAGRRPQLLQTLVDLGAYLHARMNNGCTVLMEAVEEDNVQAIEFLLKCGVELNATNQFDHNAFTWAIRNGKPASFHYFMNTLKVDVDQRDYYGATPLMWAAFYHQTDMVEKLIKAGANLNIRITREIKINTSTSYLSWFDPKFEYLRVGSTALTFAKRYGIPEIVRLLVAAKAEE